jgi:hypothetical protein
VRDLASLARHVFERVRVINALAQPPRYNLLVLNAPAAAKLAGAFLFYLRL